MIKIMIAEDELWVRRGLKEQIDWTGLGVELIGEASDGEEALTKIKEERPDIVLTDVYMPHMDGLKLIEMISAEFPEIKAIVISGYSEFELVQKALLHKAANYILKPINEKVLNQALARAIDEISQLRAKRDTDRSLWTALNKSYPAFIEKSMNSIILNDQLTHKEFMRVISDLGIEFDYGKFQTAVIHIVNYSEILTEQFEGNEELFSFSVGNIIYELCGDGNVHAISFRNLTDGHEFIIIYGFNIADESNLLDNLREHLIRIKNCLRKYLNIDALFGIGRLQKTSEGIPGSYHEAVYAARRLKNELTSDHIAFFENIKRKDMKDNTIGKVTEYIHMHYHEQITLETIAEIFYINFSYLSRIFKAETGDSFTRFLTNIRIEKAKQLMLNENLKAQQIAEMVGYDNANYFSKIFRKTTGYSPTDYRNSISVKKNL